MSQPVWDGWELELGVEKLAVGSTQYPLSGPPGPMGWGAKPASKEKVLVARQQGWWAIKTWGFFAYVGRLGAR